MDRGTHLARESALGRLSVSSEAVAQIVGSVAAESYGIVGMAGRRFPRLPGRDRLTDGIEVRAHDGRGRAIDEPMCLPAVGANGATRPLRTFLGLSPFQR